VKSVVLTNCITQSNFENFAPTVKKLCVPRRPFLIIVLNVRNNSFKKLKVITINANRSSFVMKCSMNNMKKTYKTYKKKKCEVLCNRRIITNIKNNKNKVIMLRQKKNMVSDSKIIIFII